MNCKRITLILLLPAILLTIGTSQAQVKKVKHVVLLGLDGLGAYAIPQAEMPNLKRIMESGSYSLEARTVLPSSSAVNWASMLMGSGPTAHGYTEWGSKRPEIPSAKIGNYGIYPSIFVFISYYYRVSWVWIFQISQIRFNFAPKYYHFEAHENCLCSICY